MNTKLLRKLQSEERILELHYNLNQRKGQHVFYALFPWSINPSPKKEIKEQSAKVYKNRIVI